MGDAENIRAEREAGWHRQYRQSRRDGGRFTLTDKERFEVEQIVREQLIAVTKERNLEAIVREQLLEFTRPRQKGWDFNERAFLAEVPPRPIDWTVPTDFSMDIGYGFDVQEWIRGELHLLYDRDEKFLVEHLISRDLTDDEWESVKYWLKYWGYVRGTVVDNLDGTWAHDCPCGGGDRRVTLAFELRCGCCGVERPQTPADPKQ